MKESAENLAFELLRALPDLLPSMTVTGPPRPTAGAGTGLLVDVRAPNGSSHRLYVESRVASAPSRLVQAIRQLKTATAQQHKAYPVLASSFLSHRARQFCQEEGVGYVDLAGNCYLQFSDVYVQKIVDRNPSPARGRPASLFSRVSSRILRALLEEPDRSWRVSELAAVAQVSLGQASNVCRRLLGEGYAAKSDRRLRLAQPDRLLEAWREESRVPEQTLAAYYSFERDPDALLRRVAEVAGARNWRYALTAFSAASRVAPFVHGVGTAHWYVADRHALEEWVSALQLRPVESGPNVILRIPYDGGVFYRAHVVDGLTLVGNVQLYLDLWNDAGRGREQAEFLRQQVLKS